jgi:chaperonin GroES
LIAPAAAITWETDRLALGPLECQQPAQSNGPKGGCTMNFRPLHDRVAVRRLDEEPKTKGGIIIPDTAKEKPMQGEVVAVGPGARDDKGELVPMGVQVGDRVLFGKWSGTEVKLDDQELLIMKEADIMGVLEASSAAKAA